MPKVAEAVIDFMYDNLMDQMKQTQSSFETIMESFVGDVSTIESLTNLREYLGTVPKEVEKLQRQIDHQVEWSVGLACIYCRLLQSL